MKVVVFLYLVVAAITIAYVILTIIMAPDDIFEAVFVAVGIALTAAVFWELSSVARESE